MRFPFPKVLLLMLTIILVSGTLQACSTASASAGLKMLPMDKMPAEVQAAPSVVQASYQFAAANPDGQSLALLHNSTRNIGLAVRWRPEQLPCFIVWKNTVARADGFVTGLEPSTNFTYFKSHERGQGRVVTLPPNGKWSGTITLEMHDERPAKVVDGLLGHPCTELLDHRHPP